MEEDAVFYRGIDVISAQGKLLSQSGLVAASAGYSAELDYTQSTQLRPNSPSSHTLSLTTHRLVTYPS